MILCIWGVISDVSKERRASIYGFSSLSLGQPDAEDGDNRLVGNVRNHLPSDTSSHVSRFWSSATPLENFKCRIIQCRPFGTGSLVVVVVVVVVVVAAAVM